jgi:acetyl esterase
MARRKTQSHAEAARTSKGRLEDPVATGRGGDTVAHHPMKKIFLLPAVLIALFLLRVGAGAAEIPGEARVYKKVDGRELKLHVFKPKDWKAADQRPAMVFFHGGGWTGGSPVAFVRHSEYLASRGMVAISVEYRLVPREPATVPFVSMQDAKSALRWVRSHAKELGIDPARIGAGGGSAGGHLAAFTALVPGYDDPADDLKVSAKPAALALFNPFVGYKGAAAAVADYGAPAQKAAARFGPKAQEFLASTPANHVKKDAPPTIIFHGAEDVTVPLSQVKSFADDLKQAGARCELVVYEGQAHGFFNRGKPSYETVIAMDKFLASLGWLKGPPAMTVPADADSVADAGARKGKKKKAN